MHAPHNWKVANAAAQSALTVAAGDVGKYCCSSTTIPVDVDQPLPNDVAAARAQGSDRTIRFWFGRHAQVENLSGLASYPTARANGLGNVDNTSDMNKPVSTAQQVALDGKSSTSHNHDGVWRDCWSQPQRCLSASKCQPR